MPPIIAVKEDEKDVKITLKEEVAVVTIGLIPILSHAGANITPPPRPNSPPPTPATNDNTKVVTI